MKTLIKTIPFALCLTAKIFAMEAEGPDSIKDHSKLPGSLSKIQRDISAQSISDPDALTPGTIEKLLSPLGYRPFDQARSPQTPRGKKVMRGVKISKFSVKAKRDACLLDSIKRITASTAKNSKSISRKDILTLKRYYADHSDIQQQIDDFAIQFENFQLTTQNMHSACKHLTRAINNAASSSRPSRSGYEDEGAEESILDENLDHLLS